MTSFSGSPTDGTTIESDLQLAPKGQSGPDFSTLKQGFEDVVANIQPVADQAWANYWTRYAIWPGQSSDGKKHSRAGNGQANVFPWEGASDLRVYLTDDAINSQVALLRMAFKKASLVASPIEAGDFKRAQVVGNLMKWLLKTQVPQVDREVTLLANYILEKGMGALGVFWEDKQEKTLQTVTLQQLQQQFPDIDMLAVLMDEAASDQIIAYFEEIFDCGNAKAKKMVRELIRDQTTTVATLGRKVSRPVLRAFNLDEQLLIPPDTTDEETASGMYRVEYYTPEQLRAFVHNAGWDAAWVEKAIETCRGKILTLTPSEYMQPLSRSMIYQQQKFTNKIGVVHAYQRLSDEDGVSGIYCTVFSPCLPPDDVQKGYAKFGLLPYAHGQYPFIIFRREFLSRRLHDSRGIPEPGKAWQDAIKAHMDSRIDAASIAILPPICHPMGRQPSRIGAGAFIPERRPGENHFMDRPSPDGLTEQSQALLTDSFRQYFGAASKEGDPADVQNKRENLVDQFLTGLSAVCSQVFALYQQYGDDQITFRVLGLKAAEAVQFIKGDPQERYDFYFSFDVQSGDFEKMAMKWKAAVEGIQLLNREGNVNFGETLQAYLESIDPNIAERVLDPVQVGRDKVVKEEQDDLAAIFAGIPRPIKIGTPPELALQVMQQYVQQAPDVQQRLQSDESFRKRLEVRAKQYQQQVAQERNKLVGVYGSLQPGQTQ